MHEGETESLKKEIATYIKMYAIRFLYRLSQRDLQSFTMVTEHWRSIYKEHKGVFLNSELSLLFGDLNFQ